MIGRADLNERVQEWGLREDVVEKDYVIGWLLWGIGSDPRLSATWAFKGGTCLKKCYMETYRFSEDLDFTILPGGPSRPDEILGILSDVNRRINDESGIVLDAREPIVRLRPNGSSLEGRVYYIGPRNTPDVASIRLDLTISERVARPTVLRAISHQYPDQLPPPASVRCYSFEEVFAEKLRAMGERCRPRDLYDIVNLFRQRSSLPHAGTIHAVFVEKCESKGVEVFTLESLESSPFRSELEGEWANMLGHQLLALPPIEHYWGELPDLFAWLEGRLAPSELPSIEVSDNLDPTWAPPPTAWVWGQGIPLEAVRFAAANHLCVELGYGDTVRLIEPYSLRRTREGNMLLYATKAQTGEIRGYRVDRIQSINVSSQPFIPRVAVEFSSAGAISAPPTSRRTGSGSSRRRTPRSGVVYVVECSFCGKQFKRSKYGTSLRPHKEPGSDYDCSGRTGFEVDRNYSN